MNKITLQINLAPGDYLLLRDILKHQLKVLAGQVDEILLIIESKASRGRFSAGWETYRAAFDTFLLEIEAAYPVRLLYVDYQAPAKRAVGRYFFGLDTLPDKDYRGGPFYAYFFGLMQSSNNLVFHLDADMFLGGGSQTWVSEAVDHLRHTAACLTVSPLPGPPRWDGELIGQQVKAKLGPFAFELRGMSTRIFMLDKSRFEKHKLLLRKPGFRDRLRALLRGHPAVDLPERLISAYMESRQLRRIDFLGSGQGLWSLHPPYRTQSFFDHLPELIRRIEAGDLPDAQRGFYDVIDEVCDWSEAREKLKNNRWWRLSR